MKKLLTTTIGIMVGISVLLTTVAFSGRDAYAAKCGGTETILIECGENASGQDQVCHILNLIVEIMSIGIGILAVIGVIITGIQYLTAGGNEEKTRKSKRRMYELVIGLVLYAGLASVVAWMTGGKLFCGGDGSGSGSGSGSGRSLACEFNDVYEGDKYAEAICKAKDEGIATGDGNSFNSSEKLLRKEGIVFAYRAAGKPSDGSNNCDPGESEGGEWYYDAAKWGCSTGAMLGVGDNDLNLEGSLTVRQFVTMIWRVHNYKEGNELGNGWPDEALNWAKQDEDVRNSGILNNPDGAINRGQAVYLTMELLY